METLGALLRAAGEFATGSTEDMYRAWVGKLMPRRFATSASPAARRTTTSGRRCAPRLSPLPAASRATRQLLAASRQLVEQELDKPGTVEPTLLALLVNLAALRGDAALYDRYLKASKAATLPELHYRFLYGLTAFSDPALVRRTMDLTLSDEVRSQDAKVVIGRMLVNADSQTLAWQLVRERWNEIQKKTGEFVGNTLIVGSLSGFCDAATAAGIKAFFAANKVPDAERTLQQSLERIDTCARGAAAQAPKLAEWLKVARALIARESPERTAVPATIRACRISKTGGHSCARRPPRALAWAAGDLLQVEAALAWAAQQVQTGATGKLEAFTQSEAEVVDALTSRILPSVDGRPGAREAGVLYFIDRALTTFNAGQKKLYADGIADLNRRAARKQKGAAGFAALTPAQQDDVLRDDREDAVLPGRPLRHHLRHVCVADLGR